MGGVTWEGFKLEGDNIEPRGGFIVGYKWRGSKCNCQRTLSSQYTWDLQLLGGISVLSWNNLGIALKSKAHGNPEEKVEMILVAVGQWEGGGQHKPQKSDTKNASGGPGVGIRMDQNVNIF